MFLKVTSTEIKVSAGRLQQRTCPLAIVALSKRMHSLAHGSFSDLQSWHRAFSRIPTLALVLLPFIRSLMITSGPLANPGYSFHLKILKHIQKSLLPQKVTYLQVPGVSTWNLRGAIMLSTSVAIPLSTILSAYNLGICEWAPDFLRQFRGPSEIWL